MHLCLSLYVASYIYIVFYHSQTQTFDKFLVFVRTIEFSCARQACYDGTTFIEPDLSTQIAISKA